MGLAVLAVREMRELRFHPYLIQGSPGPRAEVDLSGSAARRSAAFPLDLNAANPFQLQALPGIGKKLAFRIVEDREKNGRYGTLDGLLRVKGITKKKLALIQKYVVVGR